MKLSHSFTAAACLAGLALPGQETEQQPNIVIYLADDLGAGSAGCYGADPELVRTPNIDRLSGQGVRFTNAHTPSAVCSPTRYGLLTGRYCWRTSLKSGTVWVGAPLLIDEDRYTLPKMLKEQGYCTGIIGKWHLGFGHERPDKKRYFKEVSSGPRTIGFDYYFGVPHNHGDLTGIYMENENVWQKQSDKKVTVTPRKNPYGNAFLGIDAPQRKDEEVMDVLTRRASDWIKEQSEEKPFFLYFAATAVHEPITPSERFDGKSKAGPYAGFIQDVDWSVGEIMKALEESGQAENTIFLFTSDNGGVYADVDKKSPKGMNTGYWVTKARKAGLKYNGNNKGGKHVIYQGGTKVPYIVKWPGKLPPGTSDETINLVDTFATLSDALSLPLPAPTRAAEDSISVYDAWQGKQVNRDRIAPFITHSAAGTFAVREGDWKYIEAVPQQKKKKKWKPSDTERALYNLDNDPLEENNLLTQFPEIAAKLQEQLNQARSKAFTRPERPI